MSATRNGVAITVPSTTWDCQAVWREDWAWLLCQLRTNWAPARATRPATTIAITSARVSGEASLRNRSLRVLSEFT